MPAADIKIWSISRRPNFYPDELIIVRRNEMSNWPPSFWAKRQFGGKICIARSDSDELWSGIPLWSSFYAFKARNVPRDLENKEKNRCNITMRAGYFGFFAHAIFILVAECTIDLGWYYQTTRQKPSNFSISKSISSARWTTYLINF